MQSSKSTLLIHVNLATAYQTIHELSTKLTLLFTIKKILNLQHGCTCCKGCKEILGGVSIRQREKQVHYNFCKFH